MRQLSRTTRQLLAAWMTILVCLTLLGAALTTAYATEVRWSAVTEYVDGTPIPASDAVSYRIEWAKCGPGGAFTVPREGFHVAAPGTTSATVPAGDTPGLWCFRMYSITAAGVESNPTADVLKFVEEAPKQPKPPTGVSLQ